MKSCIVRRLALLPLVCSLSVACDLDKVEPTITDKTSPWYDRGCPLTQHQRYKSDLVADCRCFNNQAPVSGIDLCKRPYNLMKAGISIGEGPTMATAFNIEFNAGFLDESKGPEGTVYVAASFGASTVRSGAVLEVDLATGNRRIVSGFDPTGFVDVVNSVLPEVGSGPSFGSVMDVRRSPKDGQVYAYVRTAPPAEQEIVRVDLETGERTLMWKGRRPGFPQCVNPDAGENEGTLQTTDNGFAIDDDGWFYIAISNPTQGRGIVRIDSDFSRCEVFSGIGRGVGPYMSGFVNGFEIKDGKLYGFTTQPKQFIEFDLVTGDRQLIYNVLGVTPPERHARWDATRNVWWLAGFQDSVSIQALDLENNIVADIFSGGFFDWMPLGAAGPVQINSLNYGAVWVRSNGNLLVAQDGMSIVEYEPSTGNSVILSL
jgi:hypothetical protein